MQVWSEHEIVVMLMVVTSCRTVFVRRRIRSWATTWVTVGTHLSKTARNARFKPMVVVCVCVCYLARTQRSSPSLQTLCLSMARTTWCCLVGTWLQWPEWGSRPTPTASRGSESGWFWDIFIRFASFSQSVFTCTGLRSGLTSIPVWPSTFPAPTTKALSKCASSWMTAVATVTLQSRTSRRRLVSASHPTAAGAGEQATAEIMIQQGETINMELRLFLLVRMIFKRQSEKPVKTWLVPKAPLTACFCLR